MEAVSRDRQRAMLWFDVYELILGGITPSIGQRVIVRCVLETDVMDGTEDRLRAISRRDSKEPDVSWRSQLIVIVGSEASSRLDATKRCGMMVKEMLAFMWQGFVQAAAALGSTMGSCRVPRKV